MTGSHSRSSSHTAHAIPSTTFCSGVSSQAGSRWATASIPPNSSRNPTPHQSHDRGGAGHIEWGGDPGQAAAVPPLPRLLRPLFPVGEPLVVPGRLGRAQQPLVAGVRPRLPPPPRQHPRPGRDVEHPVAQPPSGRRPGSARDGPPARPPAPSRPHPLTSVAQQPAGPVAGRLVAGRRPTTRTVATTTRRRTGGRATRPPPRCRAGTADGRRTNSAPRPPPSPHAPSSPALAWPAPLSPLVSWPAPLSPVVSWPALTGWPCTIRHGGRSRPDLRIIADHPARARPASCGVGAGRSR